ncbi:MAG: hypothetical protein FJ272_13380, partial [Planctomycetes bacterium]|nr:hypothetical protein [Planctomycetota bacterium]
MCIVFASLSIGGTASADLTVNPLSDGSAIHQMRRETSLYSEYGEGKMLARKLPAELEGLPAIKAKEAYRAQAFELSEPARAYWVFYPRVYTGIPADWKMFRQRAFESPMDQRGFASDVYYKDFPAGKHEVKVSPIRHANVGFKALSRMTAKDCALNVHSPTEEGVFRPGQRVFVNVVADNPTGQPLAAVIKWGIQSTSQEGPPRSPQSAVADGAGSRTSSGLQAAGLAQMLEIPLPPRQETKREIPLPNLAPGFHLLDAELWIGGEKVDARRFPVGLFDIPKADPTVADPFFPVGAYNKFFLTHDREISRIYLHAICHSLRTRGLNTLVGPAMDDLKEELDIAGKYGVKMLMRVDQEVPKEFFGHPTILAYMFGDEPKAKDLARYKEKYDAFIAEHPERPLVTAMVGESVGSLTEDDPVAIWKALGSQVRMARFYALRKADYDLVRFPVYKQMLPPFTALHLIERCSDAPWWYVIQGFGGRVTAERPDPYWRNPTPEEFTPLAHLALAYGARAIISWPLQSHGPEPSSAVALIAQETLEPEDGKYAAFAKVAAQVAKAKEILLRHRRAGFEARTDQFEVLAVPREDPKTTKKYLYLVNMDAKRPRTA